MCNVVGLDYVVCLRYLPHVSVDEQHLRHQRHWVSPWIPGHLPWGKQEYRKDTGSPSIDVVKINIETMERNGETVEQVSYEIFQDLGQIGKELSRLRGL